MNSENNKRVYMAVEFPLYDANGEINGYGQKRGYINPEEREEYLNIPEISHGAQYQNVESPTDERNASEDYMVHYDFHRPIEDFMENQEKTFTHEVSLTEIVANVLAEFNSTMKEHEQNKTYELVELATLDGVETVRREVILPIR